MLWHYGSSIPHAPYEIKKIRLLYKWMSQAVEIFVIPKETIFHIALCLVGFIRYEGTHLMVDCIFLMEYRKQSFRLPDMPSSLQSF
jgi:hypothetical protein